MSDLNERCSVHQQNLVCVMIISVRRIPFDSKNGFAHVEMSNEFVVHLEIFANDVRHKPFVEITPCNTMHVSFEIDARKSFLIGST